MLPPVCEERTPAMKKGLLRNNKDGAGLIIAIAIMADARTCLAFGVFFSVFNRKQAAGFNPMPGTCSITEQRVGV